MTTIRSFLMKTFLLASAVVFLFSACSTKVAPLRDVSNAKMALIKAESQNAKVHALDDLVHIKMKYQNLQKLMHEERFDEAKFLAQVIQADARLLEKKSARIMIEKEFKKLQGEINVINKDFTEIKD